MYHRVTCRAISLQQRFLVMRAAGRAVGELFGDTAVAFETKLPNLWAFQQSRICRTMRCVTSGAAFDLHRRMFENERPLFVGVAPDTRSISTDAEPCLLGFKSAVGIVTVATAHRPFHDFVLKGFVEVRFDFGVAGDAELLFIGFQHRGRRIERRSLANSRRGTQSRSLKGRPMGHVAIRTADIVAPVFPAAEIVMTFFPGMAGETRVRYLL